jgi:hypothetical protein
MRRRITMLVMAALMALTMSFGGAAAAFAEPPGDTTVTTGEQTVDGTGNQAIFQQCVANFGDVNAAVQANPSVGDVTDGGEVTQNINITQNITQNQAQVCTQSAAAAAAPE